MPGGSLAEIETQVLIAEQRKYLTDVTAAKLTQQLDELGRILSGLMNSLKDREGPQDTGLRTQD
jgi:four helix bundle protein